MAFCEAKRDFIRHLGEQRMSAWKENPPSPPSKLSTVGHDEVYGASSGMLAPPKSGSSHRRRNSLIMLKHVRETPDELVDQAVAPNVNAEWVNMKGTSLFSPQAPG